MVKSIPCYSVVIVMALSLLFNVQYHVVDGERILMVVMPQRSHVNEMVSLGEELLSKGHEVFIIVYQDYPDEASIISKGMQTVTFEGKTDQSMVNVFSGLEESLIQAVFDGSYREKLPSLIVAINEIFQLMHEDESMWRALRALHFDFAMVDGFIYGQASFLVPYRLSIPYGYMYATGAIAWLLRTPNLPSFILTPLPGTEGFGRPMSFMERFRNLLYFALVSYKDPDHNTKLLVKYAPEINSWSQLALKSRIFFVTRDHILDDPLPTMSHTVFLPGPTPKKAKKLTDNLENFILQSKEGSVLISFGSSVDRMPIEIMLKFLDAFQKLPQYNFVWKIDKKALKGNKLPKNAIGLPWLPQNDILGQDKIVLFVTHCGNNGMYESVYHGVPMIGFPLFAEQHHNARRLVNKDIGIPMDILNFTSDELAQNIKTVIEDERYHKNIKKLSSIYKDRPLTTQEEMVYWIEHVMKFGGEHLRSPAIDMPLYQFLCLDLVAVIFGIFVFTLLLLYYGLRCIFKIMTPKPTKEKVN